MLQFVEKAVEVEVELVDGTGDSVVEVTDGEKCWSQTFDVLSGDEDRLVQDLEARMNRQVEGESPLAVLIRRRVAQARAKIRREVIVVGKDI